MKARRHPWSERHIASHGVDWSEIDEALEPPTVGDWVQNGALRVLGTTYEGRYLAILVSPDEGADTVFVITARDMDDDERRRFRTRGRKG